MLNSSQISQKYPTFRKFAHKNVYSWLKGKRSDDNAEGLWRIHDGIYDLSDFVSSHPGGADWLRLTKGTDITEAFEVHHISSIAEKMLPKFKVGDAKQPRNMQLSFDANGFYRTLKGRVREVMKTIDRSPERISNMTSDALLVATFAIALASAIFRSYSIGFVAGIFLTWTIITAHNYFHRRDNWRMRVFNLCLMSYREWRVSHAMSHHLYANSVHDLEVSMFEPYFHWLPNPQRKSLVQRYISWIYGPLVYTLIFMMEFVSRIVIELNTDEGFHWDDAIPLSLPVTMYLFSDAGFMFCFTMWLFIISVGSFMFGLIGLNAAHHHPEIWHEGDAIPKNIDWGMFQLESVRDRSDTKNSHFLVLTSFGNHALHHLFPTLDHGLLPQLFPALLQTIEEFKGKFVDCPWIEHIIGQHKQLARIKRHDLSMRLFK